MPHTPDAAPERLGEARAPEPLEHVVAGVLGALVNEIDGATGPATDARWTSLRHLQLMAAVRRVYDVQLSPRQVRSVRSVDDLRLLVEPR